MGDSQFSDKNIETQTQGTRIWGSSLISVFLAGITSQLTSKQELTVLRRVLFQALGREGEIRDSVNVHLLPRSPLRFEDREDLSMK